MKKLARCFLCLLFCFSVISFTACNNNSNVNETNINIKNSVKRNIDGIGEVFYLTVSNNQIIFKFDDYIEINTNSNYTVSKDVEGIQSIPTKSVELSIGNNLYYIYVTDKNNKHESYVAYIHRNYTFNVYFNSNGGTNCSTASVEEDKLLTNIPTPSKTGYTFAGWDYDFANKIENDVYTNAKWTANQYTITYNVNCGDELQYNTQTLTYGESYTLVTPTKLGYDFAGWYYGETQANSSKWNIAENCELVAHWTPKQYTVTYNVNGGNALQSSTQIFTYDESYSLIIPTRTGYTFNGWYYGETKVSGSNWNITENCELIARWTVNKYTITYNVNGGDELQTNSQTFTYDESYILVTPTRYGYIFAGWYYGSIKVNSSKWNIAEDCKLVAHWTPKTNIRYQVLHYQENVSDSDYTLFETETLYGTTDANVTPNVKTYTGFTAPSTQRIKVTPDGNTVVKYYYTRNNYTITFVSNGGSEVQSVTQKYNSSVDSSIKPVRENYTFENWYTDINLTNTFNYKIPANNLTVYAYWSEETKPFNFDYNFLDNSCTIICWYVTLSTLNIPSYIGGKPVTEILDDSLNLYFTGNSYITNITIPSSVTTIGIGAFWGCSSLKSIEIPNSVTSIGNYAFCNCSSLTNIEIPSSVTSIYSYAFGNCSSLTSIVIPSSVAIIDYDVFSGCSSLNYNIYNNGKYLGNSENPYLVLVSAINKEITSFNINNNTRFIYSSAFNSCSSLTSITIPISVTSIGYRAFENCSSLTSVTFGESSHLTSIGNRAFENCISLNSITIPSSVTSIGSWAFKDCRNLRSVIFKNPNGWSADKTSFTSSSLLYSSAAAYYLTKQYYYYIWTRS